MPVQVLNGVAIPLLNAVANGVQNGATFALPALPGVASWSTSFGSAPASGTISLQVSNDGTVWTTVDTSTSTAGETRQLPSVIALFVRAIISAQSGGTTTTVTLLYKGFNHKPVPFGEEVFTSMRQTANATGALETLVTFALQANHLKNNGDALVIQAWTQLAANANNKLTAITTGAFTLCSRSAAENNLPRLHRVRIVRTGGATSQSVGCVDAQGQGTLVTLQAPTIDWTTSLSFNLVAQGVAANDIIARGFQAWYQPVNGTYVGL